MHYFTNNLSLATEKKSKWQFSKADTALTPSKLFTENRWQDLRKNYEKSHKTTLSDNKKDNNKKHNTKELRKISQNYTRKTARKLLAFNRTAFFSFPSQVIYYLFAFFSLGIRQTGNFQVYCQLFCSFIVSLKIVSIKLG